MAFAGIDVKRVVVDLEDDSVLLVDTDAPFARKVALEWFRIADAAVAVAVNALDKAVDSLERLLVLALPVGVFVPSAIVPEFLHAMFLRRRFEERRVLAFGFVPSSSTSRRSW